MGSALHFRAMRRISSSIVSLLPAIALVMTAQAVEPGPGTIELPDLGDESMAVISPADEKRMGETVIRQARQAMPFLNDPELNYYIQHLGDSLVAHSDGKGQRFHFYIVDSPAINAFAVPGGFVVVFTGLIVAAETEAELASVMAHEIAHVTQRHIPRMIAEAQRTTVPTMAAVLGAILLAGTGGAAGGAALSATMAGSAQHAINFTRQFEQEADRIGINTLAASDYDPRAMASFFTRMQNLTRVYDGNVPEYLRTHPVTTNRIAEASTRALQFPYKPRPDTVEFYLARAKIQALTADNAREAAIGFKVQLAEGRSASGLAARYGYALSLLRSRQLDAAKAQAEILIKTDPRRPGFQILAADIATAAGNPGQAAIILATAFQQQPRNPPLLQAYATALLLSGRNAEASKLLKTAVRQHPDDPLLYKMLAQAAEASSEPLESHRAIAQFYYLNGAPKLAIEQLQIARRYTRGNKYHEQSIDARIKEIKDEIALFESARN